MPPRIPVLHCLRPGRSHTRCLKLPVHPVPLCVRVVPRRFNTTDEKPNRKPIRLANASASPSPSMDQLPHISEESAITSEILGKTVPELGQGTRVDEVLKRDGKGRKKAPKVMKEDPKASAPRGTRPYSTFARRQEQAMINFEDEGIEYAGHKFGLPELPLPKDLHLKFRYDPVVRQVTNLLMKDGKLSRAQTNMALILNHLRSTPPPVVNPERPLLPGAPPSSHLPLDPILYLTLAIDSVAPLLRIRSQKGAAGGGVALQIPVPLGLKQRRRQAVMWILDTASKRRSQGSGKGNFAQKVAEELIAIAEGKSTVWDRRGAVHKLGVAARSSLAVKRRR